jgi:dipeptidyl-peptidase-4
MPVKRRLCCLLVFSFAATASVAGAQEPPAKLTVDRIFGKHDLEAEQKSLQWLPSGSQYLTLESSSDPAGGRDLVIHDPASGEKHVLVPAAQLIPARQSSPLAIDEYALSADRAKLLIFTNSQRVWRANTRGDYWVLDRTSHELRKLGGDAPAASLMFAKFAPNGLQVGYVRENNIYVEDLIDGHITKLTNSTSPDEINGTFDWVYEEELFLRDGFRFSPDGNWIAYWQLDTRGVPDFPLVNNTDSLYPRITHIKYPKVGEKNAACRVGVVSTRGGQTNWLNILDDPRNNYIAFLEWIGSANQLVLQQFNRRQDTVRVLFAHVSTGSVAPILTEHDAAWIDLQRKLRFIHDGREFLWLSERDGWQHLYRLDSKSKKVTRVTGGDFDVIELVAVDGPNESVYFMASPENPTQSYLYRISLDGSGLKRITPAGKAGMHDYEIAADARWAIHSFSSFNTVPITELIKLPSHETVRVLTDNKALKEKLQALPKVQSEFFRVDIGSGISLDAWCILPPHFDPTAKYPLLVYVYGEPAGQTVLDTWDGDNHLWHEMLAIDGYIVMSFDNRGTPAPRGRAWRKAVFHQVGSLAPKEQAAAVTEVLRKRPYIDKNRVGIWGWSGGGSMTLNAILKFPDLYTAGIAIAPVANQRFYDTIYQERYMGLPGDNVEGFAQGSPVNFASQLKGKLLLIHGTGDDNCHYQGTEALINELIRHNKPFTMMAYPNRSHGIFEGQNTTLHLRELMTRWLRENLPPGPIKPAPGHEDKGSTK